MSGVNRKALRWVLPIGLMMGCQVYDPGLAPTESGVAEQCQLTRPPDRPEGVDSEDSVPEIHFALRDMVLDQDEGLWEDIAFDLDDFCTQPPDYERECDPASTSRPQRDGSNGVDNTFGRDLYPFLEAALVPELVDTERSMFFGTGVPVIRLRGWNGEDNDPRVRVALTQTVHSTGSLPDGSRPEVELRPPDNRPFVVGSEDYAPVPRWDGTDFISLRDETFLGENVDQPRIVDDNAYIRDRVIVARLPQRIDFAFPDIQEERLGVVVRLTEGALIARMADEDDLQLVEVVATGRWSIFDALATAEEVGICPGSVEYNLLRLQLEAIADVRSQRGTGGEGVRCDAISAAFRFIGSAAHLAGLVEGISLTPVVCPEAGMP